MSILALVVADAARVYYYSPGWRYTELEKETRHYLGYSTTFDLPRASYMFVPLKYRPERVNVGHIDWFSWRGFVSDVFVYKGNDVSLQLRRHSLVLGRDAKTPPATPGVALFMQRASRGFVLAPTATDQDIAAAVSASSTQPSDSPLFPPGIFIRSYSDKLVIYNIKLGDAALFVENEMFWRGWSAKLVRRDGVTLIANLDPLPVLVALRSWRLPAGDYLMQVEFTEPHLWLSLKVALAFIFLISAAIVATIVGYLWLRSRWRVPSDLPLRISST